MAKPTGNTPVAAVVVPVCFRLRLATSRRPRAVFGLAWRGPGTVLRLLDDFVTLRLGRFITLRFAYPDDMVPIQNY